MSGAKVYIIIVICSEGHDLHTSFNLSNISNTWYYKLLLYCAVHSKQRIVDSKKVREMLASYVNVSDGKDTG